MIFDEGYTPNWTEEVLAIDKIQYTNPITYKIKDLNGEKIKGSFHTEELFKAKQDLFRIACRADVILASECSVIS